MLSADLAQEIIGAAIKIHRKLGPGLLESAYEACLAHEIGKLGLRGSGRRLCLWFMRRKLECGFRADLVIDGRVIVEAKCKEALHPVDEAQLLSHLRLLNIPVGCLSTFTLYFLRMGFAGWLITIGSRTEKAFNRSGRKVHPREER
jgi:GxxExxY protein